MPLEALRKDALGRDLFFCGIASPADVGVVKWPPPHFVALLVWHADGVSTEAVSGVVEELFSRGTSWLCTWGKDCERVHDVAEEADSYPSPVASPEDAVRMTTWHTNESLEEVVDFLLRWTVPDAYYAPTTKASLVLCVGDDALAHATRQALVDAPRSKCR
jgi:hypothetical protein